MLVSLVFEKIPLCGTFEITIWTWDWFLSSVSQNVSFHGTWTSHNFQTDWTTPLPRPNKNWFFLQLIQKFVKILKTWFIFNLIWLPKSPCQILMHVKLKIWSNYNKMLCVFLRWWLRWLFVIHLKSHSGHENGFSPVWVIICLFKSLDLVDIFEQKGQPNWLDPIWIGALCN